jgi:hypothetical protein
MIDVFFISFGESNADTNFAQVLSMAPHAKRVDGVVGIHKAHRVCAESASSAQFFVVDADNFVFDSFSFSNEGTDREDSVYVWRCRNAVNGLVYGYGAIKLFPTVLARALPLNTVDMTTSVSPNYRIVDDCVSETRFNTSPFETWKSAFRECVKLSSKVIDRQKDAETLHRLDVWTTFTNDVDHAQWCLRGAQAGRAYGERYRGDYERLALINDFEKLKDMFGELS